jgi:Mrp family chromosome partitioning ATPase
MKTPKAIMVLSGKGGVGKTLVSVNLALHLKEKGVKVGLLDADFSASNTGLFLPYEGKIETIQEIFTPIKYKDIQIFSLPLILGEKSVSMTGDQYSQLLRDAIYSTQWNIDYLIVDLPAGFGDILRTAATVLADSLLGSIIVIQPAHKLDGERCLSLHNDLGLPVLGIIENMSYFQAGAIKYKIFGDSAIKELAKKYKITGFGKIPLTMEIREKVEKKQPKLEDKCAEPIKAAVDAIIKAKPQRPGFLEKLKQRLKQVVDNLIINLVLTLNSEIDIPNIQKTYGYPGGTIIRLNIMDKTMTKIISQADWIINDGKLTVAQGEYHIDAQIDINVDAIKWSILQNKQVSDGQFYSFQDALRLGHMRIYAPRSMARGIYFVQHVFGELRNNENAMNKIRPILEMM